MSLTWLTRVSVVCFVLFDAVTHDHDFDLVLDYDFGFDFGWCGRTIPSLETCMNRFRSSLN
jgi:hypothetical protein